jgi:hypothetical protein
MRFNFQEYAVFNSRKGTDQREVTQPMGQNTHNSWDGCLQGPLNAMLIGHEAQSIVTGSQRVPRPVAVLRLVAQRF